jgi:hypothetical protein
MEPQAVIPIEASPQIAGPWPRLLKMISLMVLLLCLTRLTVLGIYLYRVVLPPPQPSRVLVITSDSAQDVLKLISVATGLVYLLMAAGAVILWRRG